MEKGNLLYEGKNKKIYSTADPNLVIMEYKDDAIAFGGIKKAKIKNKGIINNHITDIIYTELNKRGIPTHFINRLDDRNQLCKKVSIIPLEVIGRNLIAGSIAKILNIEEGLKPCTTIYEICYMNEALGDPLINDHHAVALKIATYDELKYIYSLTEKINEILTEVFLNVGITLVDFKIEFGRLPDGSIILADEISPDTCRLWDTKTKKRLDKDRFKRDMGGVQESYKEILDRLSK